MRQLNQREKRTVTIGAIALALYLAAFFGFRGHSYFGERRAEYLRLVKEATDLGQQIRPYAAKSQTTRKLMEDFKLDPARLSRTTVVAQASAAIQKAAQSGGVMVGPVREAPARPGNRELGSMQMEAVGPVPALLKFLHQAESIGFPLIIESLQFSSDPTKPGPVKLNLTIVILDFEQWKPQEAAHV